MEDAPKMEVAPTKIHDNEKICYEQIWKSYWYAKYCEFTVVIHKELGYVNATQLCKRFNKQFGHWHANKNTKAMIAGLAKLQPTDIPVERMMITVQGGSGEQKKLICGTYVHPALFPHVLAWLNVNFACVVSIMVNEFFELHTPRNGDLSTILADEKRKPEPKVVDEDGDEDLSDGDSDDDGVDVGPPPKLYKTFKIFTRKDDDKFPYQAIEAVERSAAAAVRRFKKTPAGADTELLV